jgi:hypothetical protein
MRTLSATQNTTQAAVSLFPYSHSRIKRRGYTNFVVIYQEEHPLFVRFLKRCHKIIFKHAASQKGYIIQGREQESAEFFLQRERTLLFATQVPCAHSRVRQRRPLPFHFFFYSTRIKLILSTRSLLQTDSCVILKARNRDLKGKGRHAEIKVIPLRLLLSTFSWRMLDPGLAKKLHFSTKMQFFLICFLLLQVTFFTLKIRSTHKNL